jgi:hypothetical protein
MIFHETMKELTAIADLDFRQGIKEICEKGLPEDEERIMLKLLQDQYTKTLLTLFPTTHIQ